MFGEGSSAVTATCTIVFSGKVLAALSATFISDCLCTTNLKLSFAAPRSSLTTSLVPEPVSKIVESLSVALFTHADSEILPLRPNVLGSASSTTEFAKVPPNVRYPAELMVMPWPASPVKPKAVMQPACEVSFDGRGYEV